jgi:hypothetical protein
MDPINSLPPTGYQASPNEVTVVSKLFGNENINQEEKKTKTEKKGIAHHIKKFSLIFLLFILVSLPHLDTFLNKATDHNKLYVLVIKSILFMIGMILIEKKFYL